MLDHATVPATEPRTRAGSSRTAILGLAILVGSVGGAALGIWHADYEPGQAIPYQEFAPMRDAWWAWHLFGGLANTVAMVAVAIAVCLLAPARGAVWATIGAVATALGGLSFGAGLAAEGVAYAYAGDPAALPAGSRAALLEHLNDHPERYVVVILPGLLLMTLGALLISVALWRARTVPRWVPVALIAGTLVPAVIPWGLAGGVIGLAAPAATIAIGWYAWRRSVS